jgi:hypothetical protein
VKKWILGVLLSLVTVMAFALPSPRQIEDALANGRFTEAQSMVSQVLSERPDSARAHLLNAYLLVHVQHDKTAANAELNTAVGLDQKGDVKNSPLMGRVVGEIDAQPAAAPPARHQTVQSTPVVQQAAVSPVVQYQPEQKSGHGFAIFSVVLFFGAVGVLAYLLIRGANRREGERLDRTAYNPYSSPRRIQSAPSASLPYNSGPQPSPFDPWLTTPPQVIHQAQPVIVQQAPQQSFGSQVAATATGVVAGELIHDAIVGSHRRSQTWEEPVRSYREPVRETAYRDTPAPVREESPVTYQNERRSFSSGDDDSWTKPAPSVFSSGSDDNNTWQSDPTPSNNDGW